MVQRHRRRKALTDLERERFAKEAAEAHHRLKPYLIALSPLSDDYKAVLRMSDAMKQAIRDVTGDDPEWMTAKQSAYPGR